MAETHGRVMAGGGENVKLTSVTAPRKLKFMSNAVVNINGKITGPEEAMVSVFDRGFLFGDGVYETGRAYQRCPLFLEEHLKRFRHSASRLSIPVPWSDEELKDRIFETARAFQKDDLYFRMIITRGLIDHVGLAVEAIGRPTLVVLAQDLPDLKKIHQEGVHLITSEVVRNAADAQDPNIKTSNYLNSLLALQSAVKQGGDDAVMCDRQGNVAEGTTFSVFGIDTSGCLITPSLDVGILDSITRRHVLKIARSFMPVDEGKYSLVDFQKCPEVFIASSVREVVAIREWDGHRYPVPGPKTKVLREKFKAEILEYTKSQPKF